MTEYRCAYCEAVFAAETELLEHFCPQRDQSSQDES